jgi:hypothetical protein
VVSAYLIQNCCNKLAFYFPENLLSQETLAYDFCVFFAHIAYASLPFNHALRIEVPDEKVYRTNGQFGQMRSEFVNIKAGF